MQNWIEERVLSFVLASGLEPDTYQCDTTGFNTKLFRCVCMAFMQSACVVLVLNEGWADGVGGIITMHIVSESGAPYECVAVSQHNEPRLHVRCLPAWTLSTFPSARLIRNISVTSMTFSFFARSWWPDSGQQRFGSIHTSSKRL